MDYEHEFMVFALNNTDATIAIERGDFRAESTISTGIPYVILKPSRVASACQDSDDTHNHDTGNERETSIGDGGRLCWFNLTLALKERV